MDTFWINDISILFSKNKFLEVIPTSNMKINDKLNAVFRLSIYYFIIITIIRKNLNNIFIPILVGIVTIIIYNNYKKINNIETVDEEVLNNYTTSNSKSDSESSSCRLPTKDNPFMNPTEIDIANGDIQQACPSYDNSVVRELESINFNRGLYMNTNDIYNNENSQRNFYTLPVSGIINDQTSFAEWCYGRDASCKEGNGIQCQSNI